MFSFSSPNSSEVSSEVKHITMLWFHHRPCGGQHSKKQSEIILHNGTTKLTESANIQKAMDGYALNKGKWAGGIAG